MKITFLGTGTSQGVPVIACNCNVCCSDNPKDKRLRSSVMVHVDDLSIIIDCGPDFRQQMLRENVTDLDAILFTHAHKDHTGGLDDIRAFNYLNKRPMDIYAEDIVYQSLQQEYAYVFAKERYPGVPEVTYHNITKDEFEIKGVKITPIRAFHHLLPVLGFRIGNFVYLIDVNAIPEEEKEKLKNADCIVISGLRKTKHISHFSLPEAVSLLKEMKPVKGYITHISHQMGLHESVNNELPESIELSYDGLILNI